MTTEAATPAPRPAPAQQQPRPAPKPRYVVQSKWCGWWGGWGSESDIAAILNKAAAEGYVLHDTRSQWNMWFFCIPRPKLLMIFRYAPPQPRPQ